MGVDAAGRRVGETHHNARLSDEVVRQLRDAHEYDGVGPGKLARLFEVPLDTVKKIIYYQRRVGVVARWRVIEEELDDDDRKEAEGPTT